MSEKRLALSRLASVFSANSTTLGNFWDDASPAVLYSGGARLPLWVIAKMIREGASPDVIFNRFDWLFDACRILEAIEYAESHPAKMAADEEAFGAGPWPLTTCHLGTYGYLVDGGEGRCAFAFDGSSWTVRIAKKWARDGARSLKQAPLLPADAAR